VIGAAIGATWELPSEVEGVESLIVVVDKDISEQECLGNSLTESFVVEF
jgi:hypothetical protein